jgi:hypothetical protein
VSPSSIPPDAVRVSGARTSYTLVAGTSFPKAAYMRFWARMSQEGGADIPTAWANPT